MAYLTQIFSDKITPGALSGGIEEHTIFRKGKTKVESKEHSWVAKTGKVGDWAIYLSRYEFDNDTAIAEYGRKVTDPDKIKELVPCTESAFKKYRY